MAKKKNFNQLFTDRLTELMEKRDVSIIDLSKAVDISRQSISNYLACESMPNINVCKDIADFFGVSCDYLIGKDLQPNKTDEDLFNEIGLSSQVLRTLRNLKNEATNGREDYAYLLYLINTIFQEEDIETENGLFSEIAYYVSRNADNYYLTSDKDLNTCNEDTLPSLKKRTALSPEQADTFFSFRLLNYLSEYKKRYAMLYANNEKQEIMKYTTIPNEDGYYPAEEEGYYYKNGKYYFYLEGEGYILR